MMSLARALASGPRRKRRTAEWDGWREAAGPVGREGRGEGRLIEMEIERAN